MVTYAVFLTAAMIQTRSSSRLTKCDKKKKVVKEENTYFDSHLIKPSSWTQTAGKYFVRCR
jgi:hypothetical protein